MRPATILLAALLHPGLAVAAAILPAALLHSRFAAAAILLAALLHPSPAAAHPHPWLPDSLAGEVEVAEPHYFYKGLSYGSDGLVHPLRMVLNGGLGILQLDNRDDRPFAVDWKHGWNVVWKNISNPIGSIEHEGWRAFFTQEIVPFKLSTESARYWPNYTQHLIGGGMSYRLAAEWFEAHGFARPRLWSVGTMLAYHVVNEMVENENHEGFTTDPVADLYLFDPLGMVLFESDRVSRFFSETLHLVEWPYQPVYDPEQETLQNIGQNFAMKVVLPRTEGRWSLFYHFGTHGEAGLARTFPNGDCWSFAAGFTASNLSDVGRGVRTVDLVPAAGLFYDRHNSLMASLLFANTKDYEWRLNLYPGLIELGGFHPGLFGAVRRDGGLVAGVTIGNLTHLPLGLAREF